MQVDIASLHFAPSLAEPQSWPCWALSELGFLQELKLRQRIEYKQFFWGGGDPRKHLKERGSETQKARQPRMGIW